MTAAGRWSLALLAGVVAGVLVLGDGPAMPGRSSAARPSEAVGTTASDAAVGARAVGPAVTLVGDVSDRTGRSSTATPSADLALRWRLPRPPEVVVVVPVTGAGDDAVAVGDRVLDGRDATVVATATRDAGTGVPSSPDGLVGAVVDDRLVLRDRAGGRVHEQIVLPDGPTRGPGGGRRTELVGWADDLAVLRTWDVGLGSTSTWAVDRGGSLRWASLVDAYAPVGDGWFVGVAAPGTVLVDGRDGSIVPVPVADALLLDPIVVDGTAFAATRTGLVAWDALTGTPEGLVPGAVDGPRWDEAAVVERLLAAVAPAAAGPTVAAPATGPADHGAGGALTAVGLAGGRSTSWSGPGVGVLAGRVVARTPTGLAAIGADGTGWDVAVEDLVGIAVVDEPAVVVAVVAPADGPDLEALLLGPAGDVRGRASVRAVARGGGARVVAVREDVAVVDTGGGTRAVDLAAGRVAAPGQVGLPDVGAVLGVDPTAGGARPAAIVDTGDELLVGDARIVVDDVAREARWVVGRGLAAIATVAGGTAVVRTGARGRDVAAVARRAIGAPALGDATADGVDQPVVVVPGVTPVDVAAGHVLGVERRPTSGAGRLVALDPATGATRWQGPVVGDPSLRVDPAGTTVVVVDGATVTALDPATGATIWSATMAGPVVDTVVDGATVVAALPRSLVGLGLATGARRWRLGLADLVTAVTGAGEEVVVGTAAGDVLVVDRDGDVVTRVDAVASRGVADLVVVDGTIVVVEEGGGVSALGEPVDEVADRDRVRVP